MRRNVALLYVFAISSFLLFGHGIVFGMDDGPEEIVLKYCQADLTGARLTGSTYRKLIRPLIGWKNEPGWDITVITHSAHVINREIMPDRAIIEVSYDNLGEVAGDDIKVSRSSENIRFVLHKKGHNWQVTAPIFPPHVLPNHIKTHFESLLNDEGDKERRKALNNVITSLENLQQ
jgi:hypothetical protein